MPAGRCLAAGPDEHGIDMSLRPRDSGSSASLAFGVHCSVFKKRFPDRRVKPNMFGSGLTSEGHAPLLGTEPAEAALRHPGWGCWCQSPAVPASKGRSGMRGDWQDYRGRIAVSNRVASVNKRDYVRPRYIP